jgi:hypothetical protein
MGEWFSSRRDSHDSSQARSAWAGVWTFTEGHLGDFAPKSKGPRPVGDDTDRSLARSAWKSVPRKNRPVGYGMIGAANPRGISGRNGCRVS